jgi:diketogulonate reductase-like aldo/keto reductase
VALRFLLRRPGLFAIPKSADPRHAEDNARAAEIQLTGEDIAGIDQAFPLGPRPRELPTL